VPENNEVFCLGDVSLEIDRVEIFDDVNNGQIHCGWISLNVSGPGYPYPWTKRDVLRRLEAEASLNKLVDMCRATWPVPPERLPDGYAELRRKLTGVWLYDDLNKPFDWYWAINGIGQ
jgi:hypothetical protein